MDGEVRDWLRKMRTLRRPMFEHDEPVAPQMDAEPIVVSAGLFQKFLDHIGQPANLEGKVLFRGIPVVSE